MIAAAKTLEPTKRPEFFYKYRSLRSVCERRRLLQIIKLSSIYYAIPKSFNDPFDCRVPPVGSFDPCFVRYVIAAQKANATGRHAEVFETFIAKKSRTPTELYELNADLSAAERVEFDAVIARIQQMVNATGVLSFSAIGDNTLMWSHYADNHRGVCLKFALEKWPDMDSVLYPVTYSVARTPLKFDRDSFDGAQLVQAVALTKDRSWCYEQEWRELGKASGEFSFPSDALVGIIFGCMTSDMDKARITRAVAGRRHIKLYQAKIKERDFGLDILSC